MEAASTKNLSLDSRNALKLRIMSIQSELPANYADLVNELFPALKRDRVKNVKNMAVTDETITQILEKLGAKYKQLKQELQEEFAETVKQAS